LCLIDDEYIDRDAFVSEMFDSISKNDSLRVIKSDDTLVSIIFKTGTRFFELLMDPTVTNPRFYDEDGNEVNPYDDYTDDDIQPCFFFDDDDDDIPIIILTYEELFRLAVATGFGFVKTFVNFTENFSPERRDIYCNSESNYSFLVNSIKYLSCSAHDFLRRNIFNERSMPENPFFEYTDDSNQTFVPKRKISQRVMEFEKTHKFNGFSKDAFLEPFKFISEKMNGTIQSSPQNKWDLFYKIKDGVNSVRKEFQLNELNSRDLENTANKVFETIKPEINNINLQIDTGAFKRHILNSREDSKVNPKQFFKSRKLNRNDPNMIALCKERQNIYSNNSEVGICLPTKTSIKNFDVDVMGTVWMNYFDQYLWGLGFTDFVVSLWNWIVETLKWLFCIDRNPAECRYCFWTDGFPDSLNNCKYAWFVSTNTTLLDTIFAGCDFFNPNCELYSTFFGYIVGLFSHLPLWIFTGARPCVLPCLVWNIFIPALFLYFFLPIITIIITATWCIVSGWRRDSEKISLRQVTVDKESEIRSLRRDANILIQENRRSKNEISDLQTKIQEVSRNLLNLTVTTKNIEQAKFF